MFAPRVAFVAIACLFLRPLSAQEAHRAAPNPASIDAYCQKVLHESNVPGMAIAIVHRDSIVLFAIASLPKAFTVTCLGMLVDQGKLSWVDRRHQPA